MATRKPRSPVRGIVESDASLLIAFSTHDGYFRVPLTDAKSCSEIREAKSTQMIISFLYVEH
jgi:hypothetical protein